MLFNKSYKNKKNDDNDNIERDLKLQLNAIKQDLNMLQKTRYKNTIGGYYDQRFAKKINPTFTRKF